MNRVAILVPVYRRTSNIAKVYASHLEAKTDAALYFVVNEDDSDVLAAIASQKAPCFITPKDRTKWSQKINDGIHRTEEPWILCGADDIVFRKGWVEAIASYLDSGFDGVYGTNDLGNTQVLLGQMSTHPLVHRKYTETIHASMSGLPYRMPYVMDGKLQYDSGLLYEGYHHNFPDTELCLEAQQRGDYRHLRHCVIEHCHPIFAKASDDAVYQLGRSRFFDDKALFDARCRKFGWRFGQPRSFDEAPR